MITEVDIPKLPEKWQSYAQIALAQSPESLVGTNPEVLYYVILALLYDLAKREGEIAEFMQVVEAVARLNYDRPDSIRPMTNGATDAFHALEAAVQQWKGEVWVARTGEEDDPHNLSDAA